MTDSSSSTAGAGARVSAWQTLLATPDLEDFCSSWLTLICERIGEVNFASLAIRRSAAASLVAIASDPPDAEARLAEIVSKTSSEQRSLARAAEAPGCFIVSHRVVARSGREVAVVAVEVVRESEYDLAQVLRELQWGGAWVAERLGSSEGNTARGAQLLDLIGAALEADGFAASAQTIVTELAGQLGCDRVSLGAKRGLATTVVAVSHTASFGKQMDLMRSIAGAMDEACDQGATLLVPQPDTIARPRVDAANEFLRDQHGARTVLTVPLRSVDGPTGALVFEHGREAAFAAEDIDYCEAIAAAIGPVLELQRKEDRPLAAKALDAANEQLARLLGPGHLRRKLVLAAVALLSVFFAVATGEYRVSADARLEGAMRLVLVAPFHGYVAEAMVRAGDLVEEGEVLARLDSRDLELERIKWSSRLIQLGRQHDGARAARERAQASILRAQMDEATAELSRIEERLARTEIRAAHAGLVVSGDLSQSLGAAVARGDVLFELAPLDRYRVLLMVDESQVGDVNVAQRGTLILSALPAEPLEFEVAKITPVAEASEGMNTFRVEGVLGEVSPRLRPGMEGVAKVKIDERRLIWIWTRTLRDWFRMQLWRWWP